MVYTLTLNPCVDRTVAVESFTRGALNRVPYPRMDPAGKGINVSRVLKALGTESIPIACLAGGSGRFVHGAMLSSGLNPHAVWLPGETRTNLKIMEPGGILTEINEPGVPMVPEALALVTDFLESSLSAGDWLVMSGSLPPGAPEGVYADLARLARRRGAECLVDADGDRMALALGAPPTMMKPNLFELSMLTGRSLDPADLGGVREAALGFIGKGVRLVVVSMGADGALFVTADECLRAWTDPVPVGSPVGCGDTLAAAVLHGLVSGLPLHRTAKRAVGAAAAKAMKPGTVLPTREEMFAAVSLAHVEDLIGGGGVE